MSIVVQVTYVRLRCMKTFLKTWGPGKMALSVNACHSVMKICVWIPGTHMKKPGVVMCSCNLSTEVAET